MDYRLRYPDLKCKVRERQYTKAEAKLEKAKNALYRAEAQYSKKHGELMDENPLYRIKKVGN